MQNMQIASEFYNLKGIENEIELWFNFCRKQDARNMDLIDGLKHTDFFPQINIALKTLLAFPCTTATVERSFSTLRRVKTWLRSTMVENRLNGLCMLSVHRSYVTENLEELKDSNVINVFAENQRRLAFP